MCHHNHLAVCDDLSTDETAGFKSSSNTVLDPTKLDITKLIP